PLVADSDGNGTPDGEELYTFVDSTQAGVTASVYGRSNVASVTVEQADNFLSTAYGVATPIYEFELDGTFEHADLAFTYNPAEVADKGLDENNLSVYYVNEEYGQLELVPSVVDTATGTVTGRVTHFSKYVV